MNIGHILSGRVLALAQRPQAVWSLVRPPSAKSRPPANDGAGPRDVASARAELAASRRWYSLAR